MPHMNTAQRRLSAMLLLTTIFFLVEIVVGYITNSMALIADSFHMFSDAIALVIAFVSVRMSPKKWSKNTFGWARAEILGALINAVFLCALCVSILIESIKRFVKPDLIHDPHLLMIVGGLGLFINLIGLLLFKDHHHHHHHHGHSHSHHHHHNNHQSHGHSHDETKHDHQPNQSHEDDYLVNKSDQSLTPRSNETPKKKYGLLPKNHSHTSSRENFFETANSSSPSPDQHDCKIGTGSSSEINVPNKRDISEDSCKQSISDSSRSDVNKKKTELEHRVDVQFSDGTEHHAETKRRNPTSTQMNMHGVFLHVLADALGSVVVIISALVHLYTDWYIKIYIDPMLSVFMVCLILKSTWPLLTESAMILLQTVPTHIEIDSLRKRLTQEIPGVLAVHEFHVWQLAGDRIIASAHIRCHNLQDYMRIAEKVKEFFHNEGIHSTTIQPEFIDFENQVFEDNNCVLDCPPTQRPHCAPQTCCGNQKTRSTCPDSSSVDMTGGGDPSDNQSGVLLRRTKAHRSGSSGGPNDESYSQPDGLGVSNSDANQTVSATSV